ncbi:MAG TPA: PQQ-binding-like beta-propeller repeat protein [Candidatus Acidoferrales bacterium]|nr:PQQ-binding-like beta-propeller repeat protein [Candidatus Acidoferrales bacterium]
MTVGDASTAAADNPPLAEGWSTYGRNRSRTFFNESETRITRSNVSTLRPKWRYTTAAVITAAPAVSWVNVPDEGRIKIVYIPSWDGHLYALRASNGSRLWQFTMKTHPGASYPQASSPEVSIIGGKPRVFVGGGMTMYSIDAITGELVWQFDAGDGCTDCDNDVERNEVESSPTVVGDLVYFGMDTNDSFGKGGLYAVSADDGRLVWYFDMETVATCRPLATDNVRRFDGFHSAAELGLSDDFFTTRPGCNFDRTPTECGNVWASFSVDADRKLIYTTSSNCDVDNDPQTPQPPPPMPPYDEAIFALNFDGSPAWVWRPRNVDPDDLDFGSTPNLFEIDFQGKRRQVLGAGCKDGTYYVLDRDGVNEVTGRVEPYWQTKVVPGGSIGGVLSSSAVGDGRVLFSTAVGLLLSNPQRPAAWGLGFDDGAVLWSNRQASPSYGPTTAIPGVAFMGSLFNGMYARDAETGVDLKNFTPIGPMAAATTVLDGEIFFGVGIGERGGNPNRDAFKESLAPSPIAAWCLPDSPDCPSTLCDDGDVCTYDFYGKNGCESEPAPDGIGCTVGDQMGRCSGGSCVATPSS